MVLVIDATHAAHLGCYGGPGRLTPEIDRLARRGVRFTRAFSNTTWTLASTVSLLSGQLQERHGVVTNHHRVGAENRLLSEAFAEAGYLTAAFIQNIYASAAHGLDKGFQDHHFYSMRTVKSGGPNPRKLVTDLTAWMKDHAGERYFLYVHLRRPHSPYNGLPVVQARLAPECPLRDGHRDDELSRADSLVARNGARLSPDEAAHVQHLYRANLARADRELGAILDQVRGDDRALVVLTSDHGEALGQHGVYGHGYDLYGEGIDIPLIIAGPGIPAGQDDGPACTVDLAPTLLELAGIPVSDELGADGQSLVSRLHGQALGGRQAVPISGRFNVGDTPAQGLVEGRFKLVLDRDGSVRLFDRVTDPGDFRDLAAVHPEVTARLLAIARRRREASAGLATRGTVPIDVDEKELRALGYLR